MPTLSFPTRSTVYTPYFNEWNRDVYTRTEPFDESPWDLPASSTSGATVLISDRHFVGLTRVCDARFSWDGSTCRITAPEDALFHLETHDRTEAWAAYHEALGLRPTPAPFGLRPEYCTWVEQVARSTPNRRPWQVLDRALVKEILDVVDQHKWPRGRFTVDEGWCPRHGPNGFGTWDPHPEFDLADVATRIGERGHVPGLWFAPPLICARSDRARRCPALVGPAVDMAGETPWNRFNFIHPGLESADLIRGAFQKAFERGFRKFKLDLFYGRRRDMVAIARQCMEAIAHLPEPVELEGHIPDPIATQYSHVIRLNDVLISPDHPGWERIAQAHFEVCRQSSPQQTLCLDHIGGNSPSVTEEQMMEHIALLRTQTARGYPVVSLLPDRFSPRVGEAMGTLLNQGD